MTSLSHIFPILRILASTLLLLPCLFILSCEKNKAAVDALVLNGLTMGTTYTVKLNAPDIKKQSTAIKQSIDNTLDMINARMSTYIPDSELSEFNKSDSTDWTRISDELFEVIDAGINISESSNGAFDITIGPLVNLWGFGPVETANQIPDERSINSALANVNFRNIHLDHENKAIKKDLPAMYIDLSGIAKGYAVDKIAALLEKQFSIVNYMVEIGGEIRAHGENPDGHTWRIGIEMPLKEERTAGDIINLENTGMATSGDYRNFFERDGIVYSHTLDPKTGKPVTHQLKSVTVIHPQCMVADAWSTALLVAGPESGMELAKQYQLAAVFIIRDKNGFTQQATDNFKAIFTNK